MQRKLGLSWLESVSRQEDAMPIIKIKPETHRMLRDAAIYEWRETAAQQPDGDWLVPVSAQTFVALAAAQMDGESIDDVIQRIVFVQRGAKPN